MRKRRLTVIELGAINKEQTAGLKMTVTFYGSLLEFTGRDKTYNVKNSSNLHELVDELGRHYGEHFKNFLLGEETCFFLVNGTGLMMTGGMNTKLKSGDKIEALPFTDAG